MHIQCISQRPVHNDLLYGTGTWSPWEVKDVPDDSAAKMLRHTDVYVRPDMALDNVPTVTPTPPETDADDPRQEIYDKLQNFTLAQTKEFIKQNFNVEVSARKYPNVAAVKQYALMLVEQYGVLP